MRATFSSLPDLDAADRALLREAFAAAEHEAREERRPALAGLFRALGEAVAEGQRSPAVALEAAADLDTEEIERLIAGAGRHAERAAAGGHPALSAVFTSLGAALRDEQRRRHAVLARMNETIAWYEAQGLGR